MNTQNLSVSVVKNDLAITPARLEWIDYLKAFAVFFMIETHIYNEFALVDIKKNLFNPVVDFINGLVAPSFIFSAGFVFWIILQKQRKGFIKRILKILLLGYLLHFPISSYQEIIEGVSWEKILSFYQADVLHCIAVGAFLLWLVSFVSDYRIILWIIAFLLFFFVGFAPWVWQHMGEESFLPVGIKSYLVQDYASFEGKIFSSWFPIFPWLGFFWAGVALAILYFFYQKEKLFYPIFWSACFLLFVVLGILFLEPTSVTWTKWRVHPLFFLLRLSCVVILLVFFYKMRQKQAQKPIPSLFRLASEESLFIYVFHLVMIYDISFWGKTLANHFHQSFGIGLMIVFYIFLTSFSLFLAFYWAKMKKNPMVQKKLILVTAVFWGFLFFI